MAGKSKTEGIDHGPTAEPVGETDTPSGSHPGSISIAYDQTVPAATIPMRKAAPRQRARREALGVRLKELDLLEVIADA
jgi:hypothetical protein